MTTTATLDQQQHQGKCSVCDKETISIEPMEILPNNGIAMKAIHIDKSFHTWAEYRSIYDIGKRKSHEKRISIECPKCHETGLIGYYRPTVKRPEIILYFISHFLFQAQSVSNGKKNEIKHYITEKTERDIILKALGRYIEPSEQQQQQQQDQKGKFKDHIPWNTGKHNSVKTKKQMSLSHRAHKFSEEHKRKIAESCKKNKIEYITLSLQKDLISDIIENGGFQHIKDIVESKIYDETDDGRSSSNKQLLKSELIRFCMLEKLIIVLLNRQLS